MDTSKRMRMDIARGPRLLLILGFAAAGLLGTGCQSNELETGYKFTKLGRSTQTQRRAYYAGPFSPEARQAMIEGNGETQSNARRPRPGL